MSFMKYLWFIIAMPLLAGCSAPGTGRPPQAGAASGTATVSMSQAGRMDDSRDAPSPMHLVFQVDVYRVSVPAGTFSTNEEFWKRIDEQLVDVGTYDLLFKNGIRVGEAPLSEIHHFRNYIDNAIPAQKLTVTATEVRNIEVVMKADLPEQTIFYFDGSNELKGQSYDRCDNFITVSFQPTPRKPGYLRLTLCPMVRSRKTVLQVSPTNESREYAFVHPERLYDLNLCADIPRDSFLVVTTSANARLSTSIGRAFFTTDGAADRMETVLLILPRPYVAPRPAVVN
jgi:hypothetical protein